MEWNGSGKWGGQEIVHSSCTDQFSYLETGNSAIAAQSYQNVYNVHVILMEDGVSTFIKSW
jgi:hypothetical protein